MSTGRDPRSPRHVWNPDTGKFRQMTEAERAQDEVVRQEVIDSLDESRLLGGSKWIEAKDG